MPAFSTVMWVLGAVVMFFFLWFVGTGMLRSTTTPLPPPPPELRRPALEGVPGPGGKCDGG